MGAQRLLVDETSMHTDAVSGADEGVPAGEGAAELSAPDVEAVVLATRLLVAVDDVVTLPQLCPAEGR